MTLVNNQLVGFVCFLMMQGGEERKEKKECGKGVGGGCSAPNIPQHSNSGS